VLPKYGVAIMVNGCFWHGHKWCRYATRPKSNSEFWQAKIQRNKHRDEVTAAHLEALGWHVIVVWECELRKKAALEDRLNELASEITAAGESKRRREESRKQSHAEMKRLREEMLQRQASLESEVEALYPIPRRVKRESME
jgi:DNA mismatch endonuclease (patch repair protein)